MQILKKPEIIISILIAIVASVFIFNIVISIPSQKYSLTVDPIKDPESLFVNYRVILKNTGLNPLDNLLIIYDNNPKYTQNVNVIHPGETMILSPPTGTQLNSIDVKSSEGISVHKDFRSPMKMPGMIGS